MDLSYFFLSPETSRQKQYEAVRAFIVDKLTAEEVAHKFDYEPGYVYSLIRDAKSGKLQLFPTVEKGQKQRRTPVKLQEEIVELRKKNYSIHDIHKLLSESGKPVSFKTVERILKDKGFEKLIRRSVIERGLTNKNKLIPEQSENTDLRELKPFSYDCPVAGIYFFLPYIIESGILEIIQKCKLPGSSIIGSAQACLSMLLLKLTGNERLSQMESYDHEPGLGLFAGLNMLPKSTYMSTYSYQTSEVMVNNLQQEIITRFVELMPELYSGKYINLDFHSIPHYGEKSQLEKVWVGTKNKAIKGANTVFAQDANSNIILYARADILRKEESNEVKKFVKYWRKIKGEIKETLVFDCRFTSYGVLDELYKDDVTFITLRKKNEALIRKALTIEKDKWTKHKIDIPKRKHKNVSVFEEKVKLKGCETEFRQIIVKDHGRETPTFIITNDSEIKMTEILKVYAKRWHIENKLAELVAFFNLNALSSPLMIRIHFDILWTIIADTLYHRLAKDLRRFENVNAPTLFRKFINMPGKVRFNGDIITITIRKRAHTPILKSVSKLNQVINIPWLQNYPLRIEWSN